MLRQYCLKCKEEDYTNRMMRTLNKEMSPFQDEALRDSEYVAALLDRYRIAEDFDQVATDRNIARESHKVHAYMKELTEGPDHPDSQMLRKVDQGILDTKDFNVRKYLTKKYHVVKGRRAQATF